MRYWATRQGLSLPMVTSFTDGTKLQIEQCLVGNFLGADIACEGLLGPATDDLAEAAQTLAEAAQGRGGLITDYVLSSKLPHGVFVVAEHDPAQRAALHYLKMGNGPFYTLVQPNILVHLEAFKTLERVASGGQPLLHNTAQPRLSVAAVAKRALSPGRDDRPRLRQLRAARRSACGSPTGRTTCRSVSPTISSSATPSSQGKC